MILIVWEDANNCINSVVNTLRAKFPVDAHYYLGKEQHATELELLLRPPFVFNGWLIFANTRTKVNVLNQLDNGKAKNIIIIRVNNQAEFDRLKQNLSSLDIQTFDNHLLNKEVVLQWIETELQCSEDIARYLHNRCGGYLKEIIFAVQTLKRSGKDVTRKLVREFVEKNDYASMFDVTEYLLGIQRSQLHTADIFAVLYKFRYAQTWILETLTKEIELYIKVHELVADCVLDISNYMDAVKLLSCKDVRQAPMWKLKRIILNYGKVSLERLVWTKTMLHSVGKSYFDLIKIIQLVSVGGV